MLARIGGRAADDVAEVAVRNADLALFHSDIQHRIATGMLPEATWTNYRDFHLRRELVADFHRTTAERAGHLLDPAIFEELLTEAWKRGNNRAVRLLGVGVRFEDPKEVEQMEFFG